jgi:hypothetical protein
MISEKDYADIFENPLSLFESENGKKLIQETLHFYRKVARMAISVTATHEAIPTHIKKDLINQSSQMSDFIGRARMIVFILEEKAFKLVPESERALQLAFCKLFFEICNLERAISKLCTLTLDTYVPGWKEVKP